MPFSIYSIYRFLFRIWRVKRFQFFIKALSPRCEEALIDVGGTPGYWTSSPPVVRRIDVINVDKMPVGKVEEYPEHNIHVSYGDGRQLNVADDSYDISYSNSVIEHVGEWEDQRAFAAELRRIGSKLWCQTPARGCPIEPHYIAPFIHWLPKPFQKKLVRYFTPRGLLEKPTKTEVNEMVDSIRLLTYREMKELFPDCTIVTEYLLPMVPKSYIAIRTGRKAPVEQSGAL